MPTKIPTKIAKPPFRLTPQALTIIGAIRDLEEGTSFHGYGLKEATGLGHETIYVVLRRMAHHHILADSDVEPEKSNRRMYIVTDKGHKFFQEWCS